MDPSFFVTFNFALVVSWWKYDFKTLLEPTSYASKRILPGIWGFEDGRKSVKDGTRVESGLSWCNHAILNHLEIFEAANLIDLELLVCDTQRLYALRQSKLLSTAFGRMEHNLQRNDHNYLNTLRLNK